MRAFAAVLLALGLLFLIPALMPPFGTVRLTVGILAAVGFGGALGLLLIRRQQRYWTALLWVGIAASSVLAGVSPNRLVILPIVVNVVLVWGLVRGHWTATARPPLPDASRTVHPLLYVPVPWMFVIGYLIGVGLQALAPVTIQEPGRRFAFWLAGIVLVIAGSALAGWGLLTFRRAHTTTVPLEKSATVVTWGPYRFSRNPMYVGLTLIYLGEAAIFAQLWPVVLLVPTLAYVNFVVIPFEEA